jgi:hypothetical protein
MEVDSRIYDHYMELLTSSVPKSLGEFILSEALLFSSTGAGATLGLTGQRPPSLAYVTHFWRLDQDNGLPNAVDLDDYQTITLLESRTMIESGTTGLRTWLASFILAQYLILNPGANVPSETRRHC